MLWFGKQRKLRQIRELQERFRWKLENLRHLLRINTDLMETLSDVQSYAGRKIPDDDYTYDQISNLVEGVALMIESLNHLTDDEFYELYRIHRGIGGKIQHALTQSQVEIAPPLALSIDAADRRLLSEVGGKAAHLGELRKSIPEHVPKGFVVTTAAYHRLLNENNLVGQLRALFSRIDADNLREADITCSEIRRYVENSLVPEAVMDEIEEGVVSICPDPRCRWAVRSSAVGEDGLFSFAGQFASILGVPPQKLAGAYLKVIASRFNTSAVRYRLTKYIKEAESPMAVLFIPMVDAASSGVIYTRDLQSEKDDQMVISSVKGLAAELVGGQVEADSYFIERNTLSISKREQATKRTMLVAADDEGLRRQDLPKLLQTKPSLTDKQVCTLAKIALEVEHYFGVPCDIEWALDKQDRYWILQSRPLVVEKEMRVVSDVPRGCKLLAEGGATIFPGHAQGRLQQIESLDRLNEVEPGVILLARNALPQIVSVFGRISGLITEVGHPTSHAATLAREYSLPTIFNLTGVFEKLRDAREIGLDASRKKVYAGLPWPNLPRRSVSSDSGEQKNAGPLDELLFRLNLVDTAAANFTPGGCRSLHDMIRFIHEKAVTALFSIGDSQVANLRESLRVLESPIPLQLTVLDIGDAIDESLARRRKVPPEGILSEPFKAMWRGIRHPDVKWTGRQSVSLSGLASVMMTSMSEDASATRQLGAPNYLIVGRDYLNFNARMAYHYSMIDALVSDRSVNNYINFRFRGGGAARARRGLRAKFVAGVLLYEGFSVDQREDLVTAWYKGYDKNACEARLEKLGILMGCFRQLDMLFDHKDKVKYYIEQFLAKNYRVFH